MSLKNISLTLAILFFCTKSFSQKIFKSFDFQGDKREYIVYLPASYNSANAYPVVLAFHGFGDTISNFSNVGFNQLANTEDFIAVYPNGLPMTIPFLGSVSAWRIGTPVDGTVDDVAFTAALIDTLQTNYHIDTQRVFATGFSMGGFFCHRLACEMSNRIAAIASCSGTMQSSTATGCHPGRHIPVMHIHGSGDTQIGYNGGGQFSLVLQFETVNNTINKWVDLNECVNTADSTRMPDIRMDGFTVDRFAYTGCGDSSEVLLFRVNGANHQWMQNNDIVAVNEIWDFFSRHKKRQPTEPTSSALTQSSGEIKLHPNPFGNYLIIDNDNQPGRCYMYDHAGRVVLSADMANSGNRLLLNTTPLTTGVYFLKVETPKGIHVKKVIKQD